MPRFIQTKNGAMFDLDLVWAIAKDTNGKWCICGSTAAGVPIPDEDIDWVRIQWLDGAKPVATPSAQAQNQT